MGGDPRGFKNKSAPFRVPERAIPTFGRGRRRSEACEWGVLRAMSEVREPEAKGGDGAAQDPAETQVCVAALRFCAARAGESLHLRAAQAGVQDGSAAAGSDAEAGGGAGGGAATTGDVFGDDSESESDEGDVRGAADRPRQKRKFGASSFIDNAAEESGDEKGGGDDEMDEEDAENSDDREFINNSVNRRERRRKKRRRIDALTQDDYDLIKENTGRRIERNIDDDVVSDDDDEDEDDSDEGDAGAGASKRRRRLKSAKTTAGDAAAITAVDAEDLAAGLFGDDAAEAGPDPSDAGPGEASRDAGAGLDGFIEEDEEEDDFVVGGYATVSENTRRVRDLFGETGLELLRGDLEKYLDDVDDEDLEGAEAPPPATERDVMRKLVEPEEHDLRYMRDSDEVIAREDIPERLQLRQLARGDWKESRPTDMEIKDEAEWINRLAFNGRAPKNGIIAVLKFLKKDFDEVPLIIKQHREQCSPVIPSDVWVIDELDERWDALWKRRTRLLGLVRESDHPELQYAVQTAEWAPDLNDVQDFLAASPRRYADLKVQVRNARSRLFMAPGPLEAIVKQLALPAKTYGGGGGDALFFGQPETAPTESPDDAALGFVRNGRGGFPSTDAVLSRARSIAALRLAINPLVRRFIRHAFRQRATVSTRPTKKGLLNIDWEHQYYPVHRIVKKPVREFRRDGFLLMARAEKEGYIEIIIRVTNSAFSGANPDTPPPPMKDGLFDRLCELYAAGTRAQTNMPEGWAEQRKRTLWCLLVRHLDKLGQNSVRETLLDRAWRWVARKAADSLTTRFLESGRAPADTQIIACVAGPRDEAAVAVALSASGELVDHIDMHFIKSRATAQYGRGGQVLYRKKQKDLDALRRFAQIHNATTIVVAADSLDVRGFFREIRDIAQERDADCLYVDPSVARVYSNTNRSTTEFRGVRQLTKMAISLGRFAQDPVAETAGLMNVRVQDRTREIMSLDLHPLQADVPARIMEASLTRAFVRAVNHFGVDINEAVAASHKRDMVQFVCGLGPRKANQLVAELSRSKPLKSRLSKRPDNAPVEQDPEDGDGDRSLQALVKRRVLGPTVFDKCSSFFRIPYGPEPLDATRVHPSDYELAQIVVDSAWANAEQDEELEVTAAHFADLTKTENHHLLKELDLKKFAEQEDGIAYRKWLRLELIKEELKAPFYSAKPMQDQKSLNLVNPLRIGYLPFQDPTDERLFELLTGESAQTLRKGTRVTARVTRIYTPQNPSYSPRIECVLADSDSGIRASIEPRNLMDEAPMFADWEGGEVTRWLEEKGCKAGAIYPARVLEIDFKRFKVSLTTRDRDLKDKKFERRDDIQDSYLEREMTPEEKKILADDAARNSRRRFIKRQIQHPNFFNMTQDEAEEYLKDNPGETVVFRPSHQSLGYLMMTWKYHDDLYVQIPIKELNKPDPTAIGEELKVGENVYEDLDEILARYIPPMQALYQSMIEYKKFFEGGEVVIDDMCKDQRERQPGSIPYFISLSTEKPGQFVIAYMRGMENIKHEYIKLCPDGYMFRKRTHKPSVQRLIRFFKKEMMKKDTKKKRTRWDSGPAGKKGVIRPPPRAERRPAPPPRAMGGLSANDRVMARYSDGRMYPSRVVRRLGQGPGGVQQYQIVFEGYEGEGGYSMPAHDLRPMQNMAPMFRGQQQLPPRFR